MKLYGYTTVFRYVYENESIENFYYFCSDEYMPSDKEVDEIKEDLEIGDNDIFELFGHTANDFNGDKYLSDRLSSALTVEDTPKEYVDLQLAYITTQYIDKEDKIGIIKSLIKLYQQKCNFKQYRSMYKINLYALNKLLYALEEREEIKSTRRDFVVTQLRHILGNNNDEILLKLTSKENVRTVKHHLDISVASKFIAEYYGIEAPTYRRNILYKYIDKNNPTRPLYKNIIHEQEEFWYRLKMQDF